MRKDFQRFEPYSKVLFRFKMGNDCVAIPQEMCPAPQEPEEEHKNSAKKDIA